MREQAKQARIISDALTRHDGYRSYQARFMVANEEEEEMTVRLFLKGWRGATSLKEVQHPKEARPPHFLPPEAEIDSMDLLTKPCIEGLRQWLADQGAHGAWDEIKAAVRAQFGAPERLEKNSGSPLGTNSSQTGLPISSGDLATSDGNSTTSSITPIPNTRSPATSGASRSSRSGKNGKSKAVRRRSGRTGAPS
jgi:hypothetical protein